jgi:hypothetical protein
LSPVVRGDREELPKLAGIQEESFDFAREPEAESSTTAGGGAAITTKDAHGANGFGLNILFVVTAQIAVSIESPDEFAVGAGRAFEHREARLTLLL